MSAEPTNKLMHGRWRHVRNLTSRVTVGHTKYPFEFTVSADGLSSYVVVRIRAIRPCNNTGVLDEQYGRPWLIQGQDSDDAILNTLVLAVLTFEEHEIREGFKFDGKALYEPKH